MTKSDYAIRKAVYDLLLVFFWYVSSISYRLRVISDFTFSKNKPEVDLAARWRPKPEVTLPFESVTPILYKRSVENIRPSLTVQKIFSISFANKFGWNFPLGSVFESLRPLVTP